MSPCRFAGEQLQCGHAASVALAEESVVCRLANGWSAGGFHDVLCLLGKESHKIFLH